MVDFVKNCLVVGRGPRAPIGFKVVVKQIRKLPGSKSLTSLRAPNASLNLVNFQVALA